MQRVFVSNWKEVLRKSAVVWVGALGALLPEVPGLVLRWLDSSQADVLTPEAKDRLRFWLLLVAVPLARVWQQSFPDSLPDERKAP